MSVLWTVLAANDIQSIAAHIAADNPRAAQEVVRELLDAVAKLAQHPGRGRPGRVLGTRELVVAGSPYVAAYRVHGEDVQVLRVLHGARKWPADL